MTTVTVLGGPERRRRWTKAEKLRIVEESLAGDASVAEVARRHDVHANLLHVWRRQAQTGVLRLGPGSETQFAPVAIVAGSGAVGPIEGNDDGQSMIEVVLRNGRVLRLPERMVPGRVAVWADALEGQAR